MGRRATCKLSAHATQPKPCLTACPLHLLLTTDPQTKEQMVEDPKDLRRLGFGKPASTHCLRHMQASDTTRNFAHPCALPPSRLPSCILHRSARAADWQQMRMLLRRMPLKQINSGASKDEGGEEEIGEASCSQWPGRTAPHALHQEVVLLPSFC